MCFFEVFFFLDFFHWVFMCFNVSQGFSVIFRVYEGFSRFLWGFKGCGFMVFKGF